MADKGKPNGWNRRRGLDQRANKVQMVALRERQKVEDVEATYTTSEEAGQISNVQVHAELWEKGIEEI